MFKRALDVTYSSIKNNFVLLPETYLRLINNYVSSLYFKCKKKSITKTIDNRQIFSAKLCPSAKL